MSTMLKTAYCLAAGLTVVPALAGPAQAYQVKDPINSSTWKLGTTVSTSTASVPTAISVKLTAASTGRAIGRFSKTERL